MGVQCSVFTLKIWWDDYRCVFECPSYFCLFDFCIVYLFFKCCAACVCFNLRKKEKEEYVPSLIFCAKHLIVH